MTASAAFARVFWHEKGEHVRGAPRFRQFSCRLDCFNLIASRKKALLRRDFPEKCRAAECGGAGVIFTRV
jgi:hypothetical protein